MFRLVVARFKLGHLGGAGFAAGLGGSGCGFARRESSDYMGLTLHTSSYFD